MVVDLSTNGGHMCYSRRYIKAEERCGDQSRSLLQLARAISSNLTHGLHSSQHTLTTSRVHVLMP